MAATAKLKIQKSSKTLGQFTNLPSAFKTMPKGAMDKNMLLQKIDGLKRVPVRQLQEAANAISQLNRYNLKSDRRVELVQAILAQVYSVMARHYKTFQSQLLSLPESKERRETILACIDIAEQGAISYKHLFKEIYSPRALGYRRNRQRCIEAAVRILEFTRISQRFRALRHQKLPASQWQDINRVFFSLTVHGDIEQDITLLGSIGTWVRKLNTQSQIRASAQGIYLSLQLFGLLDAASWSARLFHTADAYLETISSAMVVHTDHGRELEPGWLITSLDRNGPPLFQREPNLPGAALLIEYTGLYNSLVQEYEELAKMKFLGQYDESKLSRPLLDLESIERFPLLEAMLFGLRPRERKSRRHAAFGHENLRLQFGFADSFASLLEMASEELRYMTKTRTLNHSLSRVSAGLSDDSTGLQNSRWEIVNFSSGGILVMTRESVHTNPIQVGQLVAFHPNEDVKRPLLGYVSRINRPNDMQVDVAIVRFSNHAESAIMRGDKSTASPHGIAVIIFKSLEHRWCLIARHEDELQPGSPFKLIREDAKQIPARLGHVMLTKQEFVVFELSAPGMS